MEQKESHSKARKQITIRLSEYEHSELVRKAKLSKYDTIAEYHRWVIVNAPIRKPIK